MKNSLFLLISVVLLFGFNSCRDKYTETYMANVPVYMALEEWRAMDITSEFPRPIIEAGKIYLYQDYLFIVDKGLGIHIVNNTNPSSPQNIAFLSVLGCADVAVRNNALYVDSYYDLLSFNITDPGNPELTCRIPDAFESNFSTSMSGYDSDLPIVGLNNDQGVVVAWIQEKVSIDSEAYQSRVNDVLFMNENFDVSSSGSGNVSSGIGGSMAQFTITDNYLYVLRPSTITSFNLNANTCPQQSSVTTVSWQAETIFPYNNHLFLGTTSGMMIYNLNNPASPEFVSEISHLTACDPVVVQGDRAYVTIRSGNACMGVINQLIVIDISNYNLPVTIAEYNLVNPHGLGIDGNTLFICDGSAGLKVYDAQDELAIENNMIAHYSNINTYDVIPYNDVLIMSAEEGIYQYDYTDPQNISLLSFMSVN